MSMLQVHAEALREPQSVYHEFLAGYKKNSKELYGFVEGDEDPSFYRGMIENMLPPEWNVDLWPAGNKTRVIELYNCFDWTRFSKERIIFLIDRDLSFFVGEKSSRDINIYITEKYSIENNIVSRNTCDRVLSEVCNLNRVKRREKNEILNLFEEQLSLFQKKMIRIMAWIIHWKQKDLKPSLNDILMRHLFAVDSGRLLENHSPKGFSTCEEYIHGQCNIPYKSTSKIIAITKEFKAADGPKKFVRGKYELWFLVEFVISIYKNIKNFSAEYTQSPKMKVSFSQANAIILIAPRARIPASLKNFINRTHLKYIEYFEIV